MNYYRTHLSAAKSRPQSNARWLRRHPDMTIAQRLHALDNHAVGAYHLQTLSNRRSLSNFCPIML